MCERKSIILNNLHIISCSYHNSVMMIIDSINQKQERIFIHLNLYNYYILNKKILLKDSIREKCIFFFEGIGMKAAILMRGGGWSSDINGTDLSVEVIDEIILNSKSVYFLGGENNILNSAIERLKINKKELQINGFHHGYFSLLEEEKIVKDINLSGVDLLVIGMGMQKEAEFLNRNASDIKIGTIWLVGGLFDILSGKKSRAPLVIRTLRLEWLFRFFQQPIEKFKRNFVVPFWFFPHIINSKISIKE